MELQFASGAMPTRGGSPSGPAGGSAWARAVAAHGHSEQSAAADGTLQISLEATLAAIGAGAGRRPQGS
jgi:hypothetical protein